MKSLLTSDQYHDYKVFKKIAGQINWRSPRGSLLAEQITPYGLKNEDDKSGVSSTYTNDSYLKIIDASTGNSRILLHADATTVTNSKFSIDNPKLIKQLNKALTSSPSVEAIIQLDSGRIIVNADTFQVLPLTYNQTNKVFDKTPEKALSFTDQYAFINGIHKNTAYSIKKVKVSNTELYKIELRYGDQKPGEYKQKQQNTTLLVTGNSDREISENIRHFLDATPVEHRQALYYGSSNGNILQTLRDDYKTSQNKAITGNVRFYNFNNYRLDQAKLHLVGKDKHATPFHYLSDEDIKRTAAANSHNLDKALNPLNPGRSEKNPDELRVLIQLESDEYSINKDTYNQYQRYPEHTIIVQMNNNGDFILVNGVDNISKFTDPKYKDKIIFHPLGHGDRFHQGNKTPETLARNISQFVDNAPEVMAQIYNAKYPDSALNKSQINIIPSHFNMDGCSLGKRGGLGSSIPFLKSLATNLSLLFMEVTK